MIKDNNSSWGNLHNIPYCQCPIFTLEIWGGGGADIEKNFV